MLITIFSIIFILGTQNVVYALATATTCDTKTSSTSCNATAGCYWNNRICSQCPGGTYKEETGTSCTQCPNNLLGDWVTWDTSILGQTSQNECHWTSTCNLSGQYTDPTGGCKYCQEKNKNNEYYYLYADSTGSQTGTLGDATTDYFSKFCRKCGKNTQPTDDGATSCKCITGYVASNTTNDIEIREPDDYCEPKRHKITYFCDVGGIVNLFEQYYANIDSPCYVKDTIEYCPTNRESPNYQTCKNKHKHFLKYDDRFFIPNFLSKQEVTKGDKYETYDQTWCLDYYDPSPSDSCKKTGHAIIGWYSKDAPMVAFATRGSTTDITSVLGNSYTIHSDQLTYKWTEDLYLYPIWKQKIIDCPSGHYLNNKTETCTGCPAGYYCPGVSDGTIAAENPTDIGLSPCPFGSTSNPNSNAITDCYLKPAVKCEASSDAITDCYSGTKFCGASTGDCIYMPASAEPAKYTGTTETNAQ